MCVQENSLKASQQFQALPAIRILLKWDSSSHFLFVQSRKPVIYGIIIHIQPFFDSFIRDTSGPWTAIAARY